MEKKIVFTDILIWGFLTAYFVFIGGYVFTLISNIATTL
jgi:hypothetical protein